jgi:hypothetical protein
VVALFPAVALLALVLLAEALFALVLLAAVLLFAAVLFSSTSGVPQAVSAVERSAIESHFVARFHVFIVIKNPMAFHRVDQCERHLEEHRRVSSSASDISPGCSVIYPSKMPPAMW